MRSGIRGRQSKSALRLGTPCSIFFDCGFAARLAATLWFALAGMLGAQAQSRPAEYNVKAAYLFNFARFVEWPANGMDPDPIRICVLGSDPFGASLDATLAGGTIRGKSVIATRISRPEEAANCQILFIGDSEDERLREILEALRDAAVLTVSDLPQFAERGGMIQFILEQGRVRFDVNLTASAGVGLMFSSDLLKLARRVKHGGQAGG